MDKPVLLERFCNDPKCICRVFADFRNTSQLSYSAIHKPLLKST
jgi:hypothetical protein